MSAEKVPIQDHLDTSVTASLEDQHLISYRNTRVKSEKIVTKFGESLNLVMFLVNILVKN